MIHYLIYSSLCMGVLLLFYHIVLSKEKIYQINRYYLLISLLFSLSVPFIPMGMTSSLLDLDTNSAETANIAMTHQVTIHSNKNISNEAISNYTWVYPTIFWVYSIITFFLLLRLIWHLYRMRLKTLMNPATSFKRYKVALLDEEVIPHTFGKTIFVNKRQYENNKIPEEVLLHELMHARQNHSLDILCVEILKAIGWFNPLFYFYKTAIQLNHEFIADEKVLSTGTDTANYQALLLQTCSSKSVHYLSTSFNFKITKKRFKMMTINNITHRSYLKIALIIPIFLILGVTFGCNPIKSQKNQQNKIVNVKIVDSGTIKIDGKPVSLSNFKSAFSNLAIDPQKTIVSIKMRKDLPVELLTKVQKALQKQGALRINYSAIPSKSNQAGKTQYIKVSERNILRLYVNQKGDVFVNQNRISISSLEGLVEDFITNNGKVDNLSVSPKDAVIAVKVDKETPYNIYRNAINEVVKAYDELRNQASTKLFGKPFQSLENGSQERKQIKNMYPKQVSIAKPANS